MKIINAGGRHESVEYRRQFDYVGQKDWGFSFPCDPDGRVDVPSLPPAARENFLMCQVSPELVDRGAITHRLSWYEAAIGLCPCGAQVVLDNGLDNECDVCGRVFNMSGQEVVPSWKCDEQGVPLGYYEG